MTTYSLYRAVGIACVACVLPSVGHAQDSPSHRLWATMEVKDGLRRPEGLSFELFGRPVAIEFVVVAVNDSPGVLVFPSSFLGNLGVRLERAQRVVPSRIAWQRIEVALTDEDPTEVGLTASFNVQPEGVVRFHGALTTAESGTFSPGDYSVRFDFRRAVAVLRDGNDKPWTGYYGDEGTLAVRVTEPRTLAEQRRANSAAADAALLRGDAAAALRPLTDMLRADPNDVEALYGIARAYKELRRYREAAAAFENLLPRVPRGERTSVYDEAATVYLELGDDARAEATLVTRYGADAGKRRLAQLKIRRKG